MKRVSPRDLVGIGEIAREAGVGKSAVTNWRRRHSDFPLSVVELEAGPVFLWPEVRDWLDARRDVRAART